MDRTAYVMSGERGSSGQGHGQNALRDPHHTSCPGVPTHALKRAMAGKSAMTGNSRGPECRNERSGPHSLPGLTVCLAVPVGGLQRLGQPVPGPQCQTVRCGTQRCPGAAVQAGVLHLLSQPACAHTHTHA
eukprot:1144388-Pelagomonas_calceolata.AAC.5